MGMGGFARLWLDVDLFSASLTILAPLIYLSALLYRWNLKASAWLWGPVALLLSPVLWANDEEMRIKPLTGPLRSCNPFCGGCGCRASALGMHS